jgi:hypothetical protein
MADRSDEILAEVRTTRATLDALLQALMPEETEDDPVKDLASVLEEIGEALTRQADAIVHLRSEVSDLRRQLGVSWPEPV